MNWKCFFFSFSFLIHVLGSCAQFVRTVTVYRCLPRLQDQATSAAHPHQHNPAKLYIQQRRAAEKERTVALCSNYISLHSTHPQRDQYASDRLEGKKKGSIAQPLWCTSWLYFILEKQKYTTQRWPRLPRAILVFSSWFLYPNSWFWMHFEGRNFLLESSLRKTFNANSFLPLL